MKEPSEREIMFLNRMREMHFIERVEAIGSIVPGDDNAELMEWRFLRDDLLPIIQDLKSLSLSELQKKYPISHPDYSHVEQPNDPVLICDICGGCISAGECHCDERSYSD